MDNADRAQDYIEWRTEQALQARQYFVDANKIVGPVNCEDCGDEIPAARCERLPGVTTCVPCQEIREQRARGWR